MSEFRHFIDKLRDEMGVPYPLAHHGPYLSGRNLVLKAQTDSRLAADFCLVATVNDQLILTSPAEEFVTRVTWHSDTAAGWRPHDDPNSPVRMLPDVRFGLPSVAGISTEILWARTAWRRRHPYRRRLRCQPRRRALGTCLRVLRQGEAA